MFHRSELLIAVLVAAGLATGVTSAAAFDRMVVFGDSLSDSGNAGRFSNGPVWVEQLGNRLGLTVQPSESGGLNYAIGGARLDSGSGPTSLPAQAGRYHRGKQPIGRILHVVFGGGNDLLAAVEAPGAEGVVDAAAAALGNIVVHLAEHGATDILVPNLPDVGITPAIRSRGGAARDHARRLTDRFNAEVERALAEVAARSDVQIYRLDVHAMAERVREGPASFGFADVETPCIALRTCDGYLFWDHVHPTTHAHARLAEAAAEMLLKR